MSTVEQKKSSLSINLDRKESKSALLNGLEKNLSSVSSSNFSVCRICHASNVPGENLISPCRCKGSLAYVHLSCLETWINESFRLSCELCGYNYRSVQTRRYTLCESLKIWLLHPRNRVHIQADIVVAVLLTLVTVGLATVCFIGMEYFIIEGNQAGVSKKWIKGSIYMFMALVLTGYLSSLYLLLKNQFMPWYNWWKATVDLRIARTPSNIEIVT